MNNKWKYCILDLVLLSIIAVFSELIASLLYIELPKADFYVSFAGVVTMIAMIRWGAIGSLVYIITGFVAFFTQEGQFLEILLLYPFAHSFIALSSIMFIIIDREEMKENLFALLSYSVVTYLCISIGKGGAMFLLNGDFMKSVSYFSVIQLFNMVIAFVILLIVRNSKGLLVNMKQNLFYSINEY